MADEDEPTDSAAQEPERAWRAELESYIAATEPLKPEPGEECRTYFALCRHLLDLLDEVPHGGKTAWIKRVAEKLEVSSGLIRQYLWLARRFAVGEVGETTLTYAHFRTLAAVPREQRGAWVQKTEQERWTTRQLQEELEAEGILSKRGRPRRPVKCRSCDKPVTALPLALCDRSDARASHHRFCGYPCLAVWSKKQDPSGGTDDAGNDPDTDHVLS